VLQLPLLQLLLSLQAAWQQDHCWQQRPLLLREECQTMVALLQQLHCLTHQMMMRKQTQQQHYEPALVVPHHCCCCCLQEGDQGLLLPLLSQLVGALQGPGCQQTALEQ
jgi:hypothetical protein